MLFTRKSQNHSLLKTFLYFASLLGFYLYLKPEFNIDSNN